MNHHRGARKFGRETNQRNALLKSLALSLVVHNKIKTTEAKAKELRPYIEKLVTHSKTGTLAARRLISSRIGDNEGVDVLMKELGPKYKTRAGGYTRVIKLPSRETDGAKMAVIEFV
ncbi:MAG: 50S ribosomal protein L17 [Candidatus Taylorbacteria bacterium]|nr:50S ribosomal protein L17 [Candidatus Taylorbacteria bacterium]